MKHDRDLFTTVPDNGRLWVIATDRPLTQEERTSVSSNLSKFFASWESHARKVVAESAVIEDRLIVISAYVPGDDVSGCGIDASVRALDEIAGKVGFERAPVLDVFFHDGQGVRSVSRAEFAQLAEAGEVTPETIVFDTSVSSVGDWKKGQFARPASESWHAGVFF